KNSMPKPEASTVIVPGSGAGVGEAEAREEVKSAIWLTGSRVLARPFALHDRDHRQLLVRQAIGLHVAQHRDREQSRRARDGPQGRPPGDPDRSAVDPFRREAEMLRDRNRRLAGL